MSVDKIASALNQRSTSLENQFFLQGQNDFASKLTLGQVIKARVLRHYEGSRYLADVNGQEKVVDSANPLRPGELIEGRVKSLGQQVELQRINVARQDQNQVDITSSSEMGDTGFFGQKDKQLQAAQQFFAERQSSLNAKDIQVLKYFLSRGKPLNTVLMSALSIKKAGLDISNKNLKSIIEALEYNQKEKSIISSASRTGIEVNSGAIQSYRSNLEVTKQLAEDFRCWSEHDLSVNNDFDQSTNNEFAEGDEQQSLAYQILNKQDNSSVNHQLMIFPIWLGEKLTEVRMAFFDQRQLTKDNGATFPYKRFVFTFQLDNLGDIMASAIVHGKHLALTFTSNKTQSTDFLSRYMGALTSQVESMGWTIDNVEYATISEREYNPTTAAIVEHYVSKDSVSRVF